VWYVYFLQLKNGDVYVGSTDDLKRRFTSHARGQVRATKAYLPAILKSYVAVPAETQTREFEIYFKSGVRQGLREEAVLALTLQPSDKRLDGLPEAGLVDGDAEAGAGRQRAEAAAVER